MRRVGSMLVPAPLRIYARLMHADRASHRRKPLRWGATVAALMLLLVGSQRLADAHEPSPPSSADEAPPLTMFPQDDSTWWRVSGQINVIAQGHGSFTSPYSGPHSLQAPAEQAVSRV